MCVSDGADVRKPWPRVLRRIDARLGCTYRRQRSWQLRADSAVLAAHRPLVRPNPPRPVAPSVSTVVSRSRATSLSRKRSRRTSARRGRMTSIEQPPIVSSVIRDGAVAELDHLARVIASLSSSEWSRPSAVEGWSIGDVATHLDLVVGLYSPFLRTVLAGRGSSAVAKAIGWLTGSILPTAAPILDLINGVIPKAVDRVLSPGVVKRQFAAGARKTRKHLLEFGPDDYARPEGGPYPLWFYLAIIVNELAIHGWDIESRIGSVAAGLSDHARRILPWFYRSGTPLMLRPRREVIGTVQVSLSEPASAMWWSLGHGSVEVGQDLVSHPKSEIRGPSGAYLLALAGRLKAADVLGSSLSVDGDYRLAESFLSSWHLI
jgi:hypothetical protein